jgi:hypothetical protein
VSIEPLGLMEEKLLCIKKRERLTFLDMIDIVSLRSGEIKSQKRYIDTLIEEKYGGRTKEGKLF